MEFGPVPSDLNNIMRAARGEQQYAEQKEEIKSAISVPGRYTVRALRGARDTVFSKSDVECLDRSIAAHGHKSFGELVDESHDAAWRATAEGREIRPSNIVSMMKHSDEILEHLEISNEQAA